MTQHTYDEKDWGLEIERCDDGDILIRQGECCCGCGDDIVIRIHPAFHFPRLAEYMGLLTRDQFERAITKSNDRLQLLAGMIGAHLPPEHPLNAAAAFLSGGEEFRPVHQADCVSRDSAHKPINAPTENTAALPDAGQLF